MYTKKKYMLLVNKCIQKKLIYFINILVNINLIASIYNVTFSFSKILIICLMAKTVSSYLMFFV